MEYGSETLANLVRQFAKLPGIGLKTAQRLALHLLRSGDDEVEKLGKLILELKHKVGFCSVCGAITESATCAICTDPARSAEIICVVEQPQDVLVIEKTGRYKGLYHVLHGVLSPIDGVGPQELHIARLVERVRNRGVKEVIVATNPSIEGDTTALYISKTLEPAGCTVTRLARGLPVGGSLEFADDLTLARAIERREKL
ncbi:MAG: recombination protein RecR [Candidatus Krumholzibacteriota bacterium]|nr:recombination protein RecR [Candidatus Krumholzibacteriota bacterium]